MIISDRNLYIAAHVTKDVKAALVKAAFQRQVSVSHLIHTILKKELVTKREDTHNQ